MNKRLVSAVALAIAFPTVSMAEIEVSGYIKNETAIFTQKGPVSGANKSMLDTTSAHDAGDLMKFENSARIFVNGEFGESSSWHADINATYDSEGANNDYRGHKSYTQNDWLRELYVDTTIGDNVSLRIGKQQVVWGTADGIKLLDIINPTDFRELNQNVMEDARIPVWMLNAEVEVGDDGNFQFIVAEARENKIAGLNDNGDAGHPFLMKGVDSITGKVNGFYNIAPALSNVAATFQQAAMGGGFTSGVANNSGLNMFSAMTVDAFATGTWNVSTGALVGTAPGTAANPAAGLMPGNVLLNNYAQNGLTGQAGFPAGVKDTNGNYHTTNLTPVSGTGMFDTSWDPANASSAFEYMSNATFATFNTFTSFTATGGVTGITTEYKRDYSKEPNAGFRFKSSFANGLNYSLNYFYHYSANPGINMSWHSPTTGEKLTTQLASSTIFSPQSAIPNTAVSLTRDQARANHNLGNATNVLLHDSTGAYYGSLDPSAVAATFADGNPLNDAVTRGKGASVLRFTEIQKRVHSIGAAFDYALETSFSPVVLRAEFLYDQGEQQPVVDKYLLSIGDLENALTMQEADYFKYVLGADFTFLTNMMVSGQFIQFINLDYIDQVDNCTTAGGRTVDCSRYTGDFSTLNLSNGMQKGWKTKEFVSLFFSKPFGDAQEHRWNNIIIAEEGGGYWDRFDIEYSISDTLIGTFEINQYWGDKDTTFGQFEKSSNVQLGLKWIIE